jgi:hypothetical protein
VPLHAQEKTLRRVGLEGLHHAVIRARRHPQSRGHASRGLVVRRVHAQARRAGNGRQPWESGTVLQIAVYRGAMEQ